MAGPALQAIGVDVGGSKTAIGLVNLASGAILARRILPTPAPPGADAAFLCAVARAVDDVAAGAALPLGLGLCELVDQTGEILSAHRVAWSAAEVRARLGARVVLEADVRAAARAEATFGAARDAGFWLYANAGTGISTAVMDGARPVLGARGLGLSAGMSPWIDAGATTVEDVAGAAGMLARARAVGVEAADFRALARAIADPRAVRVLAEGGAALGRLLGVLANALDPELIVIGGGCAALSPAYRDASREALEAALWRPGLAAPAFRVARLALDAGVIGAAIAGVRPS